MKFLFWCISLLASFHVAFAQTHSVKGTVVDAASNDAVAGARIVAFFKNDTTIRAGAIAKSNGTFVITGLRDTSYVLHVTSVGFRKAIVPLKPTDTSIVIRMRTDTVTEREVVVEGKVTPMMQKGDTVELNAAAFKTSKDASTEDLVQKMPGVTIQDGRVQAQGEQVQQVLVDGRQFFGDDPNAALRNLPAEMVDRIQVFDQSSDQARFAGITDANARKTMNIITKRGMRNGTFGKATAGYGNIDRYKANLTLNNFQGDQRVTLLFQSNNINEQNFSIDDVLGAMGGGGGGSGMQAMRRIGAATGSSGGGAQRMQGGGGGGGPMGSMGDFFVDQKNGITQTHALGVNYSDKWGQTIDATASYFFNWSDNEASTNSNRLYVIPAGQQYTENASSSAKNVNHRLNARIEARLDSTNSLVWRPRGTLQMNDGTSQTVGRNFTNDVAQSSVANLYGSTVSGYNITNDLLYRHAFATLGRTFSTNISVNVNKNKGDNTLNSATVLFPDSTIGDTIIQRADLNKTGWNVAPNLTYTEPLDSSSTLVLAGNASITESNSDRRTYVPAAPGQPLTQMDTTLTNTFSSQYKTASFQPSYRYVTKPIDYEVGVAFQYSDLSNDQQFPAPGNLQRSFRNVLPTLSARWTFETDKNIRLNYRTRTSSPTVDQLQNVINNSNPSQLTTGNPSLRQDYSHNLFARYSAADVAAGTSFFAMISGQYTFDYVGNSVSIAQNDSLVAPGVVLPRGGQITKPVNLDGYANIRAFLVYGLPVSFLSSNVNLTASVTYTRTPGIINDVVNVANNPAFMGGIVVSSNISEYVDYTVSTVWTQSWVRNSVEQQRDATYLNGITKARLNWRIVAGLVITTDVSNTLTSGYTQGYSLSPVIWNVGMAYKFLENDRAELRLTVNDVLKQNTSVTRTVSDSYTQDSQANILQRYALLTFSYNIRSFSGQSSP